MKNENKFSTGDLNLACVLMSLGIPLTESKPCSLIAHENGHTYSRYHFESHSVCGKYITSDMNNAWSDISRVPENHPMQFLSNFVRNGRGKMTISDWLQLAQEVYNIGNVRNEETAKMHISMFPESEESYALAFVYNRVELYALHNKASKEIYMSNGDANALINIGLPKYQRQELINRLNG